MAVEDILAFFPEGERLSQGIADGVVLGASGALHGDGREEAEEHVAVRIDFSEFLNPVPQAPGVGLEGERHERHAGPGRQLDGQAVEFCVVEVLAAGALGEDNHGHAIFEAVAALVQDFQKILPRIAASQHHGGAALHNVAEERHFNKVLLYHEGDREARQEDGGQQVRLERAHVVGADDARPAFKLVEVLHAVGVHMDARALHLIEDPVAGVEPGFVIEGAALGLDDGPQCRSEVDAQIVGERGKGTGEETGLARFRIVHRPLEAACDLLWVEEVHVG